MRPAVRRPGRETSSGPVRVRTGAWPSCGGRHGYDVRPPLQAGHVVTATVEGLGGTRNRVVTDTLTLSDGRFGDAAAEFVQVPDGDSDHLLTTL